MEAIQRGEAVDRGPRWYLGREGVWTNGLVFFGLWQGQFQGTAWSQQKRLVIAVVTALLFFCSILAHELSHSLVARRFKMSVSSITLFLLGGVANLRQEPPTAKAEFFMAAAGPAMTNSGCSPG